MVDILVFYRYSCISLSNFKESLTISLAPNNRIDDFFRDHVYMFPHGRVLPPQIVTRLRAIMSYYMFGKYTSARLTPDASVLVTEELTLAIIDKETSRSSTSPYSSADAHRLLQVLKEIEHYGTWCLRSSTDMIIR